MSDGPFKSSHFMEIGGHETPWNEERKDCDVISRQELAANIANKIYRELHPPVSIKTGNVDLPPNIFDKEPEVIRTDKGVEFVFRDGPFHPAMFSCKCPMPVDLRINRETTPGHYDWCEAIESAEVANFEFKNILAQGVRVWGPYITYSGIAGWFNKQSDEDTHQGIVINIEELK